MNSLKVIGNKQTWKLFVHLQKLKYIIYKNRNWFFCYLSRDSATSESVDAINNYWGHRSPYYCHIPVEQPNCVQPPLFYIHLSYLTTYRDSLKFIFVQKYPIYRLLKRTFSISLLIPNVGNLFIDKSIYNFLLQPPIAMPLIISLLRMITQK